MTRSYRDVVAAAEQQGRVAFDAMEAWVSRPLGAPDIPVPVLEGYARDLRESRERLRQLLAQEGIRDEIESALARNTEYHRSLGLSIKDQPELDEMESER
ncbi:MAG TPA: hypothetical protein VNF68_04000 [Candidatus Baltobacteraceae bacterium]|nr:hypothetical protein [Candidatus Baltobacteraceae bacterium]